MRWRAAAVFALMAAQAEAQIATDGTLGAARDFTGDFTVIEDRLGRRAGENLFHSFRRFDISDGQVAVFGVPEDVGRVIGRVTGGAASTIDGLISFADGATLSTPVAADFYFFNPAGVLIGPNAEFRTGGALHVSGGDSVIFEDGATFSADPGRRLTLTAAAPQAFGFLDGPPGPVTVRGARIPAQGARIALSGGAVGIDGAVLTAGAADLVLVAGGAGEVAPVDPGPGARPGGGEIVIRGGGLETAAGGDIRLVAGTVTLDDGRAVTAAFGAPGGGVRVDAGALAVLNGAQLGSLTAGDAPAGGVRVRAGDIVVSAGGAIRSQTQGAGRAGDIAISGFDRLLIDRAGGDAETVVESEVAAAAAGDAGLVTIRGGALALIDGGSVFSNTFGDGDAGAVTVAVDTIRATAGGQIASGARDNPELSIRATGAGGAVTVTARESMSFTGSLRPRPTDPEGAEVESSGLLTATEGRRTGRGGDLFASAPVIEMSDGAEIGAETFFDARAGDLTLEGGRLTVEGGAEISTTARRRGRAGAVTLSFSEAVALPRRGSVASRARRDGGTAGAVAIDAPTLLVGPGSRIATDSRATDGGAIRVNAARLASIDGGRVTTSVAASDGDGGAIAFRGGPLVLSDGALIASTAERGDGGEVRIFSSAVFIEAPDSRIDVSSALGRDGEIFFAGVVNDRTAESEPPPAAFFDRFALIDDFCVAAVTGGSALRLSPPEAPPAGPGATPALFGGAIPYPAALGPAVAGLTLSAGAPRPCPAG